MTWIDTVYLGGCHRFCPLCHGGCCRWHLGMWGFSPCSAATYSVLTYALPGHARLVTSFASELDFVSEFALSSVLGFVIVALDIMSIFLIRWDPCVFMSCRVSRGCRCFKYKPGHSFRPFSTSLSALGWRGHFCHMLTSGYDIWLFIDYKFAHHGPLFVLIL